ncbi:hypothetical protein KL86APRO_12547 [uncultured Alphaproteobacteria bacterium]|uniref:Uncharacterized protein n=1 Tax=uncultured Alphaproteobacteria bacterium TaxID=91750 RepID=A0A212KC23_9PROT|nr:hypothetical protein KL86APRO_12547 [uncultured Alphaproteobacteria bacterium]
MAKPEISVTFTLSELDADGIGIATGTVGDVLLVRMECTQAEFNELALHFGGVAVPKATADKARAEQARREALGRTMVEELLPLRTVAAEPAEGGAA